MIVVTVGWWKMILILLTVIVLSIVAMGILIVFYVLDELEEKITRPSQLQRPHF